MDQAREYEGRPPLSVGDAASQREGARRRWIPWPGRTVDLRDLRPNDRHVERDWQSRRAPGTSHSHAAGHWESLDRWRICEWRNRNGRTVHALTIRRIR